MNEANKREVISIILSYQQLIIREIKTVLVLFKIKETTKKLKLMKVKCIDWLFVYIFIYFFNFSPATFAQVFKFLPLTKLQASI